MKSSEVLRKAAAIIGTNSPYDFGGCWAIVGAAGCDTGLGLNASINSSNVASRAMNFFLMVAPEDTRGHWWDINDDGQRIIGLCLAAAIAESEGD